MTIRTFGNTVVEDAIATFHEAVRNVARLVDATQISEKNTTISEFRARYSKVLSRTDMGSLEIITRSNRRYVILNEDQVLTLANNAQPQRSAGDLLDGLQLLPATDSRPRAISVKVPSCGRLPK